MDKLSLVGRRGRYSTNRDHRVRSSLQKDTVEILTSVSGFIVVSKKENACSFKICTNTLLTKYHCWKVGMILSRNSDIKERHRHNDLSIRFCIPRFIHRIVAIRQDTRDDNM